MVGEVTGTLPSTRKGIAVDTRRAVPSAVFRWVNSLALLFLFIGTATDRHSVAANATISPCGVIANELTDFNEMRGFLYDESGRLILFFSS